MQVKIDRFYVLLEGQMKRTDDLDNEWLNILVSERSQNRPLQLKSKDSQEVEELNYRLDGSITEERQVQSTTDTLQEQL